MRAKLVILALCTLATPAAADAKTKELAQGYAKESAACQTRADGVTRVTTGTQRLIDDGQPQYADDLAALRAGLEQVQAYCGELTATLALLGDPAASYRALERKLDDHDNAIRKLRQTTKKTLDDLAPVISRMIPVINARVGTAAPPPSRVHIKFPSGRTIDAAVLAGTYRTSGSETTDILDYTEAKAIATLTARRIATATCAQQRQAITATDATDRAATDATRPLGLAWYVAYTKPGRRLRVACRALETAALVVSLDEPADAPAWPALEPALLAMIAARP